MLFNASMKRKIAWLQAEYGYLDLSVGKMQREMETLKLGSQVIDEKKKEGKHTYRVIYSSGKIDEIAADVSRVRDGYLILNNMDETGESTDLILDIMPSAQAVCIYPPGAWLSVRVILPCELEEP